ncbi:type 1 glutamine amidotransferase-like domain-containing protein [Pseudoalteromonas sp. JBTF-M23]|uniref:Type 1 glutamine amidotransferase-like domain-containing protein n=1 Tax=Pseudoalteromonas caenipelagi TaxID=2726988 RepID=A0A849VCD1_9GAMM|nr:pre-peptidase C-terminal domain-containing protein [Pseudoalteromonas caenipelagi]NOU50946.1 type 1 glutamine amidotransferase-like domain-containing protein [Pseudoalteromonas caenipelagi]
MKNNTNILSVSLAALLLASANSHACLTNEIESNNIEANANTGICSNTLVSGELSRNDVDWFSFDITQPVAIDISLDHSSGDDFDWFLYEQTGPAVASKETSQTPEAGSYQASAAGTYFIKLTRYSGTGWYDLNVSFDQDSGPTPPTGSCNYGPRPSKPGALKAYVVGNSTDTCNTLTSGEGASLLMGGGTDVDNAFSQRVVTHVGTGADVVVLRTSGTDAYNDYLLALMNADSVETLIVDSVNKANDPYVDWAIRSAEFVWFAGGDQSDYLNQWQGTQLQSAVQHVFDKGGVVGGTSAGMALMANSIYDPDGVSGAVSNEVVTDFCHQTLNFSSRFISIPMLDNALTDTHFAQRDRMGRAAVSLAHHSSNHFNIAASEATSIFITHDGHSVVDGNGEVYVLRESAQTQRTTLACGQAVQYQDISRVKLLPGQYYNVYSHTHSGSELAISIDGTQSNFYLPNDPY